MGRNKAYDKTTTVSEQRGDYDKCGVMNEDKYKTRNGTRPGKRVNKVEISILIRNFKRNENFRQLRLNIDKTQAQGQC